MIQLSLTKARRVELCESGDLYGFVQWGTNISRTFLVPGELWFLLMPSRLWENMCMSLLLEVFTGTSLAQITSRSEVKMSFGLRLPSIWSSSSLILHHILKDPLLRWPHTLLTFTSCNWLLYCCSFWQLHIILGGFLYLNYGICWLHYFWS